MDTKYFAKYWEIRKKLHELIDQNFAIKVKKNMQLLHVLHGFFKRKFPSMNKYRRDSLFAAVKALISCNRLSMTSLGRNLPHSGAKISSNIKRMNRLLANRFLHQERFSLYQILAKTLITPGSKPCIEIDWSCIDAKIQLYILRAALSMPGRAIVIYEECHPKKHENNHSIHTAFLQCLQRILPEDVKPIIVTDAGFRAPWFNQILAMDWDFVGRLRHKNMIYMEKAKDWILSSSFFGASCPKPRYLGAGLLTYKRRVPVFLVSYKGPEKQRHNLTINKKTRKLATRSIRQSRSNKEPWILATSLVPTENMPKKAVVLYKKRMQIEESFRDTKSLRYGFGLKESRSKSNEHMNILLLIAALASFAAWLSGLHIKQQGDFGMYQAASKKKCALSLVFLGREALRLGRCPPNRKYHYLWKAIKTLANAEMVLNT